MHKEPVTGTEAMQLLTHLEATCEELQSCAELSVVEQTLQGSQALQPHLTLLESQHTNIKCLPYLDLN